MADDVTQKVEATPDHEGMVQAIVENSGCETFDMVLPNERGITVVAVPKGKDLKSMKSFEDEYRLVPERRQGTAETTRIPSFVSMVNRFKSKNTVIFAKCRVSENAIDAKLQAIMNYHPEGGDTNMADNLDHKIDFKFPLSKDFSFWLRNNTAAMEQLEFAMFMEERIVEMVAATDADKAPINGLKPKFADPIEILELSRDLDIYAQSSVVQRNKLSSGETEMKFKSEHVDAEGKNIKLPDFFMINIPIFEGGENHRIIVRLRYRLRNNSIKWFYELYRIDNVLNDAFEVACENVQKSTELPLFFGEDNTRF